MANGDESLRVVLEYIADQKDELKKALRNVEDLTKAAKESERAAAEYREELKAVRAETARVAKETKDAADASRQLSARRRELADLSRKARDDAFQRLPAEQQLNQLYARRQQLAERLAKAGENERRSLALRIAQAKNEAEITSRIQAAAARGGGGAVVAAGGTGGLGLAVQIEAVRLATRAADTLKRSFIGAVKSGLDFNATLEDSALGISAILRAFQPQKYKDLDSALKDANGILDQLKRKALEVRGNFDVLAAAFSGLSGAAFAAGIPLEKQVEVITAIAQSLAPLDLPIEQLTQEGRSLLSGNIVKDSVVAKTLEIKPEQVAKAKAAGKLFDFLIEKLNPFVDAAKRAADNYKTALTNVQDATQQLSADLTKPLFGTLKKEFGELQDLLADAKFRKQVEEAVKPILDAAKAIASSLAEIAQGLASLAPIADETFAILKYAASIAALTLALKGLKFAVEALSISSLTKLSPWTAAAGAVYGLAKAYEALTEAIKLYQAKQGEAAAKSNLQASTSGLVAKLKEQIDLREKLGQIDGKRAEELRDQLRWLEKEASLFGPDKVNDFAREFAREFRQSVEDPQPKVGDDLPGIIKAHREGRERLRDISVKIAEQGFDLEEAKLRDSYERRLIDAKTFGEKLKEIEESRFSRRFAPLALEFKQETEPVKQEEIKAQMKALAQEREQSLLKVTQEGIGARLKEERDGAELRIQILEATGKKIEAAELRTQQTVKEMRKQGASEASVAAVERMEKARLQANTVLEKTNVLQAVYNLKLSETESLLRRGQITQSAGVERNRQATRSYLDELEKIITALEAIANANPDLSGVTAEVAGLRAEVNKLKADVEKVNFGGTLGKQFGGFVSDLGNKTRIAAELIDATLGNALDGIGNGLANVVLGVGSFKDAWADAATSIVRALAQIAVQLLAFAAIKAVLSPFPVLSGFLGLSSGGLVPGAPSNVDSVPTVLAPGEFVVNSDAVGFYGRAMMQMLNEKRLPVTDVGSLINFNPAEAYSLGNLGNMKIEAGPSPRGNDAPPRDVNVTIHQVRDRQAEREAQQRRGRDDFNKFIREGRRRGNNWKT